MIHIACNIDASYIQHCSVMLTSLLENNKTHRFTIHIISAPLAPEPENELKKITEKYPAHLEFYYPKQKILKECPPFVDSYISYAAYYRCFLSLILPPDISKILYLDCDLIVRKDVGALWDTDISAHALGCVEDMLSVLEDHYTRLNYPKDYSYFNSGVLLINLDYWRQNDIHLQVNRYVAEHHGQLRYNDQDVLNALFYDKKVFLPFRWNMQDGFFRRRRRIRRSCWEELDETMKDPDILHYTGSKKPWHDKSVHPYKSEYFKYLDLTSRQGWRPAADRKSRFVNNINKLLVALRLKKRKYRKIKRD